MIRARGDDGTVALGAGRDPLAGHSETFPPRAHPQPRRERGCDGRRPGSRAILIAERDQSVRRLQEYFLRQAGFTVEFADDGEAALGRALEMRPAVVVTEILLPRIDGLSLCRRLGEDPNTRDIPVIVFSILAAATRAVEAGAKAFLRKPLVESTFVAAVREQIAAQPTDALEERWTPQP